MNSLSTVLIGSLAAALVGGCSGSECGGGTLFGLCASDAAPAMPAAADDAGPPPTDVMTAPVGAVSLGFTPSNLGPVPLPSPGGRGRPAGRMRRTPSVC